jgi:replication factor A1
LYFLTPSHFADTFLQKVEPVSNITIKSGAHAGKQFKKREVILVDQTLKTIKMTLWDDHLNLVNEYDSDAPVIAFKGAKVSDIGGRSLSMTRCTRQSMVNATS